MFLEELSTRTLNMVKTRFPETSVTHQKLTLCNNPPQRRPKLRPHRGHSLKNLILSHAIKKLASFSGTRSFVAVITKATHLTLRLLISYIYGAPSKARNVNVVYIWTYVWQR